MTGIAISRARLWDAVALAGLVLVAVLAIGVAWRIATAVPPGIRAGDPAPITSPAALRIVVDPAKVASAKPANAAIATSGTTGTTTLPALPVSDAVAAAIVAGEAAGVVPARPFAPGRASAADRGRALDCLATAIYYEAASEPDAGQRAVAQVILNRVRHPAFPATVCGVVYQGSERRGCQFSFACDGAVARVPARAAYQRATRAAAAALAGYVFAPVGLATHYHTYAVTPAWNRGLVMTDAVGAHFFHRWKGYWGTARAFSQSYRGGEPVPGAHLSMAMPGDPTLPADISGAGPALPASAMVVAGTAVPVERVVESGQVLERWKDAGTPLVR